MATGRKTVVVGQVIDPATWGNPVWDQSVQQFASDADRTAQFPVGQRKPGAVTWLDDTKRLDVWDGAAWQPVRYDTGWTTAALAWGPGWAAQSAIAGAWQSFAYRVIENQVYANGVVAKTGAASTDGEAIVTVPVGVRPATTWFGSSGGITFDLLPSGALRIRQVVPAATTFGVQMAWVLG